MQGFLPSLHLNVGDACRRLGQLKRAQRHLEIGLARAGLLSEDGYGQMIRRGLERLRGRLDEAS